MTPAVVLKYYSAPAQNGDSLWTVTYAKLFLANGSVTQCTRDNLLKLYSIETYGPLYDQAKHQYPEYFI